MKNILTFFVVAFATLTFASSASASITDQIQPANAHVIDEELQVRGTARVYSLRVGAQGYGGVTYFNGTIINETTSEAGLEMPVTFGDDVRIDGQLWRGATSGPEADGSTPFVINDNLEVLGIIQGSNIIGANQLTTSNTGSSGQVLSLNSSGVLEWADDATGSSSGSSGDITGVTAGSGLTGGGTSGSVTLNVSGITSSMITNSTIGEIDLNISNSPTAGQYLSYNSSDELVWSDVSSSSGDITGVTAGSGLTGGGTSGSVTLTVSGVTTGMITDGTIGAADIATDAVDSAEIAANAVESSEIVASAVGASEIATNAVDSDEIAADAVESSEIAADAVKSVHIDNLDETLTVSVSSGNGISSTASADGVYGLYGVANHATNGTGVYGLASGTTNSYGVHGTSSGASGIGVYGTASASGATDTNAGGYFEVGGGTGYGVYGIANVAGGEGATNYGGYFEADGISGRGVSGVVSSLNAYSGYFIGGQFKVELGSGSNFIIETDSGGGVSINDTGTSPITNVALDVDGLIKMHDVDTAPAACDDDLLGAIYYDTGDDEACICTGTLTGWLQFDNGACGHGLL
ncbi:MAG: hypothetical protein HQ538_06980 [Parcubacteria group bacterium]|nr:hypothetical protein [Parcubacteria group bacterium]